MTLGDIGAQSDRKTGAKAAPYDGDQREQGGAGTMVADGGFGVDFVGFGGWFWLSVLGLVFVGFGVCSTG